MQATTRPRQLCPLAGFIQQKVLFTSCANQSMLVLSLTLLVLRILAALVAIIHLVMAIPIGEFYNQRNDVDEILLTTAEQRLSCPTLLVGNDSYIISRGICFGKCAPAKGPDSRPASPPFTTGPRLAGLHPASPGSSLPSRPSSSDMRRTALGHTTSPYSSPRGGPTYFYGLSAHSPRTHSPPHSSPIKAGPRRSLDR